MGNWLNQKHLKTSKHTKPESGEVLCLSILRGGEDGTAVSLQRLLWTQRRRMADASRGPTNIAPLCPFLRLNDSQNSPRENLLGGRQALLL